MLPSVKNNATAEKIMKDFPIDFSNETLTSAEYNLYYTTPKTFQRIYRPLQNNEHKGTRGHLLLIAGQKGMLGAALLAAKAALHCGLGKLTIHAPAAAEVVLQTGVPEAMFLPNEGENTLLGQYELDFKSIAIGPGIGKNPETFEFLKSLLQKSTQSLVLDADALNILSEQKELITLLPNNSILTPHPIEFDRLDGKKHSTSSRFKAAQAWAIRQKCHLVLKGAPTVIYTPTGDAYVNCSGNAGLATAGSGDVLTGIIGSLLAQGYPPETASVLGVYIHGRAADNFAKNYPKPLLTAALLPNLLAPVFQELEQDNMS